MANTKNQVISVPLNGDLNLSTLKTKVVGYEGFNDVNSTIFGGTLSPNYFKDRDTKDLGNDRPFIKDNILSAKDGRTLLDLAGYKGIKRTELNIRGIALAVFDEDHYVEVNEDKEYTVLHSITHPEEDGAPVENGIVLPFKAISAAYSEASQNIVIVVERAFLHVYDATTFEELASAPSVDSVRANIKTFYDPLNDWQVISTYAPFGDWEFRKPMSEITETPGYKEWSERYQLAVQLYNIARDKFDTNKGPYLAIKATKDSLWSLYQDALNDYNYLKGLNYWDAFWRFGGIDGWNIRKANAYALKEERNTTYKNWWKANEAEYLKKKGIYDEYEGEMNSKEQEKNKIWSEKPDQYNSQPSDPYKFTNEVVHPAYNYIYDKVTKTLVRKTINIPFDKLTSETTGLSGDSYIFTGIYDMNLKEENGLWVANTEEDYVRYRVAPIPYEIKVGNGAKGEKFLFALNYTPKILFRRRDINFTLDTGSVVPNMTQTYISNKRNGQTSQEDKEKTIVHLAGTGKYGRSAIWGKVQWPEPKDPQTNINFNNFNLFYDYGDAPYTFYSSNMLSNRNKPYTGNPYSNSVSGTSDILQAFYNYEVATDYVLYKKPMTSGDKIERNEPREVFREIVNNGVTSNISISEDRYHIGTMLETPNSIDLDTPIFYNEGKNGNKVVYKTSEDKWVTIEVTPEVEELSMLGDEYVVLYTANENNCIRLRDGKIKHFAPDWNNRFSLNGSPYLDYIKPLSIKATSKNNLGWQDSAVLLATGINVSFEVTEDPITGYKGVPDSIYSNLDNITPVAFVSKFDNIDIYSADIKKGQTTAEYYLSISSQTLDYTLYSNTELEDVLYVGRVTHTPGLFNRIQPSNFGRWYLDDGNVFYSLIVYNGQLYYAFTTSSLLDDVKKLFMVQGRTYAITKSDYIYNVSINPDGTVGMNDAIVNIRGLTFCGAIPSMALFYSPFDKTLRSFTADGTLSVLNQATAISTIGLVTYNPQTNASYICTDNGIYVYSEMNKYRIEVRNVKDIYFGGYGNKHTYIRYTDINGNDKTRDYVVDKKFIAEEEGYEIQPLVAETMYYGNGQNTVSVTDCVYLRLYSDIGPIDGYVKFTESTITDGVYGRNVQEIVVSKLDWDSNTNTAYVRYQPKFQRSVGISVKVETNCSISEIVFSTGSPETVALSRQGARPTLGR